MRDEPLDTISEVDGFVAQRMCFYAALLPKLQEVARRHGYALPVHGSLQRDLDVVAVPWTDDASDPVALIKALAERAGGFIPEGQAKTGLKPHGRLAVTIYLGGQGGYIDLSVMPRAALAEPTEDTP